MLKFAARRFLTAVPLLLGATVVVFLMVHLVPGDPALLMVNLDEPVTAELLDRLREKHGFNRPLHEQYLTFLTNLLQGDLGASIYSGEKVIATIRSQLWSTIELALFAGSLAFLMGVVLGVIAARFHNTFVDSLAMILALGGVSAPNFWLGIILILVFSVRLGLLPSFGQGSFSHLILPGLTLGLSGAGLISRLTRSSVLEIRNKDYIRTAHSKGVSQGTALFKHTLKPALIPVLTAGGLFVGNMLAGTVVVETVFARQGLGLLVVNAILNKDFPIIQGAVLFISFIVIAVNLGVDVLYSVVDPRITYR